MKLQIIDAIAIETVEQFTFSEVAKLCELSLEETQELIDYGVINADESKENHCFCLGPKLIILQTACQQRRDYDLDLFSVVICVQYLELIADLKRQIDALKAFRQL